jgi:hypothetical protein
MSDEFIDTATGTAILEDDDAVSFYPDPYTIRMKAIELAIEFSPIGHGDGAEMMSLAKKIADFIQNG